MEKISVCKEKKSGRIESCIMHPAWLRTTDLKEFTYFANQKNDLTRQTEIRMIDGAIVPELNDLSPSMG